ncbi:D-amino-acid transaminase [Pelagibius sp. Alg239-R121]|uniref:D-amino-acid transaminase n=1 Tax=Pelagibius sp. Alg239-R121 TaxID=2993448 RepID=UPI0024A7266A|nr:D-amino-acid transaminase [Pelagibius sp. Alg239-R121]
MPRQAYVNGRYTAHNDAAVHIEDRGYQFADGVYEVVPVYNGILVDEEPHLDRLERSLRELQIDMPMSRAAMKLVSRELMQRNSLSRGFVYMQITRGVAPRDHKFPAQATPALVMTTRQMKPHSAEVLEKGVKVITLRDIRWERCDIKSVSLLPNILGKQAAAEAGAYEAWQLDDDGNITEGTSANAWIVTDSDTVVTRNANSAILNGITRIALLDLIRAEGFQLEERAFSLEEAQAAREAFVTSSSSFVMPVTQIDDNPVGNGHPGLLTMKLRERYVDYMNGLKEAG